MLKHILVTLDSARFSDYVLAHAQSLAQASDAKITLMRLIDSNGRSRRRIVDPVEWHIRKMEIEASLNKMAQELIKKGLSVTTTILEGSTADQLIQYVQAHEVDLMILTKQSESVNELVHTVMKRTSTPVVVLPIGDHLSFDGEANPCYKKILVPLDGSQRAEITLPIATVLAQKCNSQLLLVHVVHKPEMPRHAPPSAEEIALVDRLVEVNRADATRYFDGIVSRLPGDVQTRLLVSDNIPATLHHLVEQENVDLIVLSAHGYSGEPQWPYGSITNHIIAYSNKPVVVVQDLPMGATQQVETRAAARLGKA